MISNNKGVVPRSFTHSSVVTGKKKNYPQEYTDVVRDKLLDVTMHIRSVGADGYLT